MEIAADMKYHEGFPVLHLSGELDMASLGILNERLDELVDHHKCAILHVNEVTYTDADSVDMFLKARDVFNQRGGTLAFVCCQEQVVRVLQTLGLLQDIDTFDNLDGAAAHLRPICPHGPNLDSG